MRDKTLLKFPKFIHTIYYLQMYIKNLSHFIIFSTTYRDSSRSIYLVVFFIV